MTVDVLERLPPSTVVVAIVPLRPAQGLSPTALVCRPPPPPHSSGPSVPPDSAAAPDWIVLDTIDQMDGLERLVVIAVGLDSVIGDDDDAVVAPGSALLKPSTTAKMPPHGGAASAAAATSGGVGGAVAGGGSGGGGGGGAAAAAGVGGAPGGGSAVESDAGSTTSTANMQTRSRLYRGLTRAHLLVVVVNELVKGGWWSCNPPCFSFFSFRRCYCCCPCFCC